MERNKLTKEDAETRIAAQLPLEKKTEQANFIIENSSGLHGTREQVNDVYKVLSYSKAYWKSRILLGLLLTSSLMGLFLLFSWILLR